MGAVIASILPRPVGAVNGAWAMVVGSVESVVIPPSVTLNLFQHPRSAFSVYAVLVGGSGHGILQASKELFPGESRGPDGTALPRV
ncbi:hypothetical protein, partial [Sphingopyxis granuli]|uniref:hypothetical protein n=1 Tax=Sphingopyxis granuli TaxID=267128 RepID=UPI000A5490E4